MIQYVITIPTKHLEKHLRVLSIKSNYSGFLKLISRQIKVIIRSSQPGLVI